MESLDFKVVIKCSKNKGQTSWKTKTKSYKGTEDNSIQSKNSLDGLNRTSDAAGQCRKSVKINRNYLIWITEKKFEKNEQSFRDLWDNNKRSNIHIIGVPETEMIVV